MVEFVDHEGNTLALLDLAEVASPSGEHLEEVGPSRIPTHLAARIA